MIDLDTLKATTRLLPIVERDLGAPVHTSGRTAAFWCPFHADGQGPKQRGEKHTPSLVVYQDSDTWHCFGCGQGGDVIAYVQRRRELDFRTACEWLGANSLPATALRPAPAARSVLKDPPAETWQAAAGGYLSECAAELWTPAGEPARSWLHARGLADDTLREWGIGYNPAERRDTWADKAVWLPRSIVLPGVVAGVVWYVKMRRPTGEPKYIHAAGGTPCLFGADRLAGRLDLVLCEGELDALLAWQLAGDLVDVATFTSASSTASEGTVIGWLPYLLPYRRVWVATDVDDAGEGAAEFWQKLTKRARRLRPPVDAPDKDITDAWRAGADVRRWIAEAVGVGLDTPAGDLPAVVNLTEFCAGAWPALRIDSLFWDESGARYTGHMETGKTPGGAASPRA